MPWKARIKGTYLALKVMPKMEITELQREDEKAWDEYVLKTEHSTFYHQIGWRNVVARTYKHRPVYLVAKEGVGMKS